MNTLTGGKTRRMIALFCMVMLMVAMVGGTMVSAYAEGEGAATGSLDNIANPIQNGLGEVFRVARVIATAVALVVMVFTGIKMLIGDARAMETGKATIFKIIAALAIIWLAPLFVETITNLFKTNSKTFQQVVGSIDGK